MRSPKSRGAKPLLILLLVFVLPVAVAKLVLSLNLYNGGVTNKGELLPPDTNYARLAMANPMPKHWQMIYLLPSQCDQACMNRLYILHQSQIALGRDQHRVNPIILLQADSDLAALQESEFSFTTAQATEALSQMLTREEIIIVDPLGSLVMRYAQVEDEQAQLMLGKAMIADLRKMLKLSRVG
ncbi:hypothetical protein [Shewanella spartinae]|uniref:hypothetical protein n=1 Tax=Shewanella spartinae TaxID=2864205 RepID=UPI001C65D2B8|nr:hypothetical protein [Shewanella spartinae]QYJ93943.1 hypothetical protein K0I31_00595 [Shewanella spartinae]